MTTLADEWLEIGTIVGAYGIQGEVKVLSLSDFPERFESPGKRWLQSPQQESPQPVKLKSGRQLPGKNLFVVRLAHITTRNQAEALIHYKLLVPRSDRLPLAEEEYHVADLMNLAVYHQGENIGKVIDFYEAGNDLLVVELTPASSPDSSYEPKVVLIPFVKAIVPVVDIANQRLEINPPAGLLDLV